MDRAQRIRDPVHGLIVFSDQDETDRIAWRLINTREFQRLRRIRQLGFSDLVFPGATHSRFAHSIGAYHTARKLVEVIRRKIDAPDAERERVALLAALLHDIGHGPFSHAFETATKAAGRSRPHEAWSAEIISGDTEVHRILSEEEDGLSDDIAAMLKEEEAKDIYATVVSSQFDADRLDYLQRDRLMTGVQFGHIDTDWLFDSLEVGKVTILGAEPGRVEEPIEEDCLHLNAKGLRVAEEYLEARFRLYTMVYMHKTTRAAERMLEAFLRRMAELVVEGKASGGAVIPGRLTGYLSNDPPRLSEFLALDDAALWTELSAHRPSSDPVLSELGSRLCDRRLYKCFDIAEAWGSPLEDNVRRRIRTKLEAAYPRSPEEPPSLLLDDESVMIYKWYDFEGKSALNKVLVKRHADDLEPIDIGNASSVIKALREKERIFRAYLPSQHAVERFQKDWREIVQ